MNSGVAERAVQLAAITGAFRPDELIGCLDLSDLDRKNREAAWRALAQDASEEIIAESYCWIIAPDIRRKVLRDIYSEGQLEIVLKMAPHVLKDDLFGAALQSILRREAITFPAYGGDALFGAMGQTAAILDAVQFARAVKVLQNHHYSVRRSPGAEPRQMTLENLRTLAEAKVKELQFRRDIQIVLPNRHYGYSGHIRRLSRHLRCLSSDPRPILLTGIGGAGKSAVLARIMAGWGKTVNSPITILLDFDRRQLNMGEPVEILKEFLRQLAKGLVLNGHLESAERDAALVGIQEVRGVLDLWKTDSYDRKASNDEQLSNTDITLGMFDAEWAAPLRKLPIALVLDTFEAIDRMGGYFSRNADNRDVNPPESRIVNQVIDLVTSLTDTVFHQMRAVVSGREEPLGKEQLEILFSHQIRLEGLTPVSGSKLLADEDLRLAEAAGEPVVLAQLDQRKAVSRILGGHPLALLVFARYARQHPDDIDKLIENLETDSGFSAAFAQTFLYSRILERIRDEDVRKLAHPGLALRQVTPDIIRLVLAGPCLARDPSGETPLSEDEAQNLLLRLQNEYWLVEAGDPPFELRHRADLRRLMMDGLFAGPLPMDDDTERAKKTKLQGGAVAVCAAAAKYFELGPADQTDPAFARWQEIPESTRELEAIYYRAFAEAPPETFPTDTALKLRIHIGEDFNTLPIAWQAALKHSLDEVLTNAETEVLPELQKEAAFARQFKMAQQVGLTSKFSGLKAKKSAALPNDFFGVDRDLDFQPRSPNESGDTPALKESVPKQEINILELHRTIVSAFAEARFDKMPTADEYVDVARRATKEELANIRESLIDEPLKFAPYFMVLHCVVRRELDRPAMTSLLAELEDLGHLTHFLHAAESASEGDFENVGIILQKMWKTGGMRPFPSITNRINGRDIFWDLYGVHSAADSYRVSRAGMSLIYRPGSQNQSRELKIGIENQTAESAPLSILIPAFSTNAPDGKNRNIAGIERIYREARKPAEIKSSDLAKMTERDKQIFTEIMRGLSEELYDPTISLLNRLEDSDVEDIVHSLAEIAPLWPVDLSYLEKRRYNSRQAPTVVEIADRCGVLRKLLELLPQDMPDVKALMAMHDFIGEAFFPFPRG